MEKKIFKDQANGYNKKQVENYIQKLIKGYEIVYREYLDLVEKYSSLANSEMTRN